MPTTLDAHTIESAPEGSRKILEDAQRRLGFVPNLYRVLSGSPAALEAYVQLTARVEATSLSPLERQVLLIAASIENGCEYCVAAHSTLADMQKLPADVIEALRAGTPIADPRLEALRVFTTAAVVQRGELEDAQLEAFYAAGYGQAHVLDVLTGVAMKTLSNYVNHIADTPLDAAFQPRAWTKHARAA